MFICEQDVKIEQLKNIFSWYLKHISRVNAYALIIILLPTKFYKFVLPNVVTYSFFTRHGENTIDPERK